MKRKLIIALYVFLTVLVVAAIFSIGIYAYKHRVVESKRFTVTATINAHDYRPPYTTYTTYYDKHGKHVRPFRHPQHYYIYYAVYFDGESYSGNREEVDAEYFSLHKDGDWAYEYEIDNKPDCFRRSQSKHGSCNGAYNVQDFTLYDCATCEYWRGKLNR